MISKKINWFINSGPSYDSDAQAFFSAAGISNATQKTAVNTFVLAIKPTIWGKMRAIYPFVGGTATTHKFNLKDPRDLDAAFRLSFTGGWTHSSTGALPNGSTGYADTFFNTATYFTSSNGSFGYYSRTAISAGNFFPFGNSNGGLNNFTCIAPRNASNNTIYGFGTSAFNSLYANTVTQAFFSASKVSTNINRGFFNGNKVTTDPVDPSTYENRSMYIGALNWAGAANYFTAIEFGFGFIGDTLTDAEHLTLYNAVQAMQTSLSRNI